jgi:hypothetical protein
VNLFLHVRVDSPTQQRQSPPLVTIVVAIYKHIQKDTVALEATLSQQQQQQQQQDEFSPQYVYRSFADGKTKR